MSTLVEKAKKSPRTKQGKFRKYKGEWINWPEPLTKQLFIEICEETLNMSLPVLEAVNRPVPRPRDSRGRFISPDGPPTIKQLWKYTETFINLHSRVNSPTPYCKKIDCTNLISLEDYARMLNEVSVFNRAVEAEVRAIVNKKAVLLNEEANRLKALLNLVINTLAYAGYSFAKKVNLKRSDIMNELLAICKTWPTVWDRKRNTLKISTNEIVIPHQTNKSIRYRFGKFYIILATKESELWGGSSYKGIKPLVKAQTPRYSTTSSRTVSHPHVHDSNEYICLGSGESAVINAIKDGRLFDAVEITMNVLPKLGRNPFSVLNDWNGVCDERFNPETGETIPMDSVLPGKVYKCSRCNGEVDQLFRCDTPGCTGEICLGCMDRCSGCDRKTCTNHSWYCEECNRPFCGSRHFNNSSDICNDCWEVNHEEEDADFDHEEESDEEDLDEESE